MLYKNTIINDQTCHPLTFQMQRMCASSDATPKPQKHFHHSLEKFPRIDTIFIPGCHAVLWKIIVPFKSAHLKCVSPTSPPPTLMINLAANMSLQMKYGVLGRVKQTVLKSTVINAQQGTLPLQNKLHLDLLHDELIPTKGEHQSSNGRVSIYYLASVCVVNKSAASFWRCSFFFFFSLEKCVNVYSSKRLRTRIALIF